MFFNLFKGCYHSLVNLNHSNRFFVLQGLYLAFFFSFVFRPLALLGLVMLALGVVGMLMVQRKNDFFVYSLPTVPEVAEILKERGEVAQFFAPLSLVVFLPCAVCFIMGLAFFIKQSLLYSGFLFMAFLWLTWRYNTLIDHLNERS